MSGFGADAAFPNHMPGSHFDPKRRLSHRRDMSHFAVISEVPVTPPAVLDACTPVIRLLPGAVIPL